MDILKKLWAIRIANYFEAEFDMDRDVVLDLEIQPVDKTTCIVINSEIDSILVFEMSGTKTVVAENLEGDEEGSSELYQILTKGK